MEILFHQKIVTSLGLGYEIHYTLQLVCRGDYFLVTRIFETYEYHDLLSNETFQTTIIEHEE